MSPSVQKLFSYNEHEAPVYALEAFQDDTFFAGGGDRIVTVQDAKKKSPATGLVNTGSTIYSLHYIPESEILLVGVSGGGMHVIDLNAKKEIHFLLNHEKGLFRISHSLKHKLILTTGGDGRINFWSTETYKLVHTENLCNEKVRCAIINDSLEFAAIGCGDGTIRLFDLKTFKEINRLKTQHESVNALCFHRYLNVLLSGGRDALLNIWNTNDFSLIDSIPAHNYAIYAIAFSPHDSFFATASRDKTIKLWDGESFEFRLRIDKEKFDGHQFSVNALLWMGNFLISGSDDKKIICWKVSK
jgi:WD40 repeat protein